MNNVNQNESQEIQGRISVTPYTAGEIVDRFLLLYSGINFKEIVSEFGIPGHRLLRRNKAVREMRAICIALWSIALEKSFPNDSKAFFEHLFETAPFLTRKGKRSSRLKERVTVYTDLMIEKKDADFSPVASYLAEVLALDAEDMRRLRLKVSLITRKLYKMIFDNLV